MVEWVLSLEPDAPRASAEFAEGLAQLRMLAGPRAQWVFADSACSGDFAAALARLLRLAEDRPGKECVLILAHVQLQFAHDTLERLTIGVDGSVGGSLDAALCWGSAHMPPGFAPDYCTVRGLERYTRAMALAVPAEYDSWNSMALPAGCQVAVATLGALRGLALGGTLRTAWLPGCFAHDFAHYHQGQRPEVVPWVPREARRVLDVGGGEGHFLALLRAERGCETHLSEYSTAVCALAAQRVDFAWPGDFLALDGTAVLQRAGAVPEPGVFDCITFLDSLEHAVDPGQWLDKAHGLLREGGCIVGSIPNVGHWSVVADLLEGRWDYCPVGIHCSTHLRFFTRRTVIDLLARHGFSVQAIQPTLVPTPPHWSSHWLATPGLETGLAELDAYAFLFRACKVQGG